MRIWGDRGCAAVGRRVEGEEAYHHPARLRSVEGSGFRVEQNFTPTVAVVSTDALVGGGVVGRVSLLGCDVIYRAYASIEHIFTTRGMFVGNPIDDKLHSKKSQRVFHRCFATRTCSQPSCPPFALSHPPCLQRPHQYSVELPLTLDPRPSILFRFATPSCNQQSCPPFVLSCPEHARPRPRPSRRPLPSETGST